MLLPTGSRLGIYEILGSIGSGGMGEVYRARDPRLDRDVAIKTVRATDAGAQSRLWREARAAARINHPGICQIYDVVEAHGDIFIVMELLEGESLASRLARGPMEADEAVRVTVAILDALTALHDRGVVHRDLKPSNVFLCGDTVKLLDFGLARPPGEVGAGDLTTTSAGMAAGTPRYMAPEQWSGRTVDPRTDLYAVGLLLFEMVAGRPGIGGTDLAQVYHAVMAGELPALQGPAAHAGLQPVITRAVAKVVEDRYETARVMADALRGAGSSPAMARPPARRVTRVVVLPFRMVRPDAELDFLSFSLPDAVTGSLAAFESLVVRSTLAGAKYAEATDLRAIAAELAVDAVICGSLLHARDQVRLMAQLVEAPSGAVVWSDTFQASRQDIIELQDQLARRVIESLSGPLSVREAGRLRRDLPASARAYEFYLRANQLSVDPSQLSIAEDLYRSALREDPAFAPAWARLGRVCRVLSKYGAGGARTYQRRAADAFEEALRLDPDSTVAHNLYTNFEVESLGRPKEAMIRLLTRVRSQAVDPDIFAGLVLACRFCGLLDASLAADRQARQLDAAARTSVMYTLMMLTDWERAAAADTEEMKWVTHYALAARGLAADAIEGYRRLEARPLPPGMRAMVRFNRAAAENDAATCVALLREFNIDKEFDPEAVFLAARALAHVGERAMALDHLEDAVARGFFCPPVLRRDPWLESLRGDPRFTALLDRAEVRSRDALDAFRALDGERLLNM